MLSAFLFGNGKNDFTPYGKIGYCMEIILCELSETAERSLERSGENGGISGNLFVF